MRRTLEQRIDLLRRWHEAIDRRYETPWARDGAAKEAHEAAYRQLVLVTRDVMAAGLPRSTMVEARGRLSRSELEELIAHGARLTTPEQLYPWEFRYCKDVQQKIATARKSGREDEARRLQRAAKTFVRNWFRLLDPDEVPNSTVLAEERAARRECYALARHQCLLLIEEPPFQYEPRLSWEESSARHMAYLARMQGKGGLLK